MSNKTANFVQEGRRLVTIRKIDNIQPIENADAIELATVDGWNVVVKKGEFEVGHYCVYFEIDSFLPMNNKHFAFLASRGTKIDEKGIERYRLRTIKLRGEISQGLLLPAHIIWDELVSMVFRFSNDDPYSIEEEVSTLLEELEESRNGIEEFLNVTKYERPEEREGGTTRAKTGGEFPIMIPKTDEDRIQNVHGKYLSTMQGVLFRESLKMEGSSHTMAFLMDPEHYLQKLDDSVRTWDEEKQELVVTEVKPYPFQWDDGQFIVASRNHTLKFDADSHFWKPVLQNDFPERLRKYCVEHDVSVAVQSEVMGAGIQGNIEKFTEHQLFGFRVYNIDERRFFTDEEFIDFSTEIGLQLAPQGDIIDFFGTYPDIKDALASAERPSINAPQAEGFVYKSVQPVNGKMVSFKVINNKYLLKEKD